METRHTHLTPDLPPVVEVPDLPGASEQKGDGGTPAVSPSGQGCGAHHEGDGRHGCATGGSGG